MKMSIKSNMRRLLVITIRGKKVVHTILADSYDLLLPGEL